MQDLWTSKSFTEITNVKNKNKRRELTKEIVQRFFVMSVG